MKKIFAMLFCLLILAASSASANPFTSPAKPSSSWSLSDAMELVGEDVFAEMLTEIKQNIIKDLGEDAGVGQIYSPSLYAVIDALIAEGVDPHEAIYAIGDASADLTAYLAILKEKGYLDELPSTFTEETANEIRKIQYAAGLPATGEITNAIAAGLMLDSVIPGNEETLSFLAPVSDKIADKCTQEMNIALANNGAISGISMKDADERADISSAAVSNYIQACKYLPSFAIRHQFYLPVTAGLSSLSESEPNDEAIYILSNSSALLSTLFYYAQYDLRHDFTGYAVEYADLLKTENK